MLQKGTIKVPIFDCEVKVIVGGYECELRRSINYRLRAYDEEVFEVAPSGCMLAHSTYVGTYYLFFLKEDLSVDIINHEKSHLAEQILKDRQITSTGEVRAYLDGWLSHKLDLLLKKKLRCKIKNKR